jgi:hypothetical protein
MTFLSRQPSSNYFYSNFIEEIEDFLGDFVEKYIVGIENKVNYENEIQNMRRYIDSIR